MKSKILNFIALLCAILVFAVAFTACENDRDKDENDSASDTVATLESSEGTSDGTSEESTEEAVNGYKVTVVDENNAPVAGVYVQICEGNLCLIPEATDDNGVVIFDIAEKAYTVKIPDTNYTAEKAEYSFPEGSKELIIKVTAN